MCGRTSAYMVKDITYISGSHAAPVNIPDSDLLDPVFSDESAITITNRKKNIDNSEDQKFCSDVIAYLNDKSGSKFSNLITSSPVRMILERRTEFKLELQDFYTVIDKKVQEWKGTEMEKYLRPTTLFNKTKFANYLGEKHYGKKRGNFTNFNSVVEEAKHTTGDGAAANNIS